MFFEKNMTVLLNRLRYKTNSLDYRLWPFVQYGINING